MKPIPILRRVLALLLVLSMVIWLVPAPASAASGVTEESAYKAIMAMKAKYPEGMTWTNDNYGSWHGASSSYPYTGGWGCFGLAYILSDAAFGTLPCREIGEPVKLEQLRVGDILRYPLTSYSNHTVVVLSVGADSITVVEGNFNKSVHWGRTLTRREVESAYYFLTRYPTDPPPRVENTTGFRDVNPKAYYYDALVWAVKNKIVQGTTSTTFSPGDTCNRAQAATFVWRACGKPNPSSGQIPFKDVKAGSYYCQSVLWAYYKGIVDGTSKNTYSPNADVTRQQVITMIWRAKGCPEPKRTSSPFQDVKDRHSYSYKAILWGYENGIVDGTSQNLFSPTAPCTRAQIVTLLYRAFG